MTPDELAALRETLVAGLGNTTAEIETPQLGRVTFRTPAEIQSAINWIDSEIQQQAPQRRTFYRAVKSRNWRLSMKNFIQEGCVIDVIAPAGGVLSGTLVAVNSIVGVANTDAAAGASVAVSVEGVYALPKVVGDVILAGQPVKATPAGVIDSTATLVIGYAVSAAGAGTTTVNVRLVPVA